ncbi:MAG: DUF6513 domain-containing protein [Gemmatimonadota bacterium]
MKVLFVTGKLAERALCRTLEGMAPDFAWEVAVMKITVAALMTPEWIAKFLEPAADCDLILLPGLCKGDTHVLAEAIGVRAEKGPADLRNIPEYFGLAAARSDYGAHDIRILAEINNAPLLEAEEIHAMAEHYRDSGADIIDIGCTPGHAFPRLAEVVHSLRAEGFEVSIDTFDPNEIRTAVDAGARWVLSVNSTNLGVARNLDATVVAIPDPGGGLETLEPTLESLEAWGTPYIVDPVIEPIGFGFAESLCRYAEVRRRYPATEMLMGIGNITELTTADTTGVNAVLIGYCQELGIRYVLTTEVIPWARGAVREIDVARRLMHYSVNERQLPKHLDDRLLTVKDPEVLAYSEEELRALQAQITDPNFRIFSDREFIYVFNSERFVRGRNIQEIFRQLDVDEPTHAFYLGKELMKAKIAVDLGKTYRQEGMLSWGYLTPPEEPTEEHVTLTQRSRESREVKERRGPR